MLHTELVLLGLIAGLGFGGLLNATPRDNELDRLTFWVLLGVATVSFGLPALYVFHPEEHASALGLCFLSVLAFTYFVNSERIIKGTTSLLTTLYRHTKGVRDGNP